MWRGGNTLRAEEVVLTKRGCTFECGGDGTPEEGVYIAYGWGIHRECRGWYSRRGGILFVLRGYTLRAEGVVLTKRGILFVWRWWYSREEGVYIHFYSNNCHMC